VNIFKDSDLAQMTSKQVYNMAKDQISKSQGTEEETGINETSSVNICIVCFKQLCGYAFEQNKKCPFLDFLRPNLDNPVGLFNHLTKIK